MLDLRRKSVKDGSVGSGDVGGDMGEKAAPRARRAALDRDRALAAAVTLADAEGIDKLSMRRLARSLDVEAMSLYHHVRNKEDILDGMVDLVFAEIELPAEGGDWVDEMRLRAGSARAALTRHPWAIGLMDSRRSPGPATLRHHDAVIGCLRAAGFSVASAAHAFSLLDSYVYGFVLQEVGLPFETPEEVEEVAGQLLAALPADEYPYLVELTRDHVLRPGYDHADEFAWGLDRILGALEPGSV